MESLRRQVDSGDLFIPMRSGTFPRRSRSEARAKVKEVLEVAPLPLPALFLGDLHDPWIAEIASALPGNPVFLHHPDDLPESWPVGVEGEVLIVQRSTLTVRDGDRLRAAGPKARILLVVGPLVRSHQLARYLPMVDIVLSEATASETIARHCLRTVPRGRQACFGSTVQVLSENDALQRCLVEVCETAGVPVESRRTIECAEAPAGSLLLWDVPVLEPDWPERLRRLAEDQKVIALLGFPDREMVRLARQSGASACLEVPCDPEDLLFVLDRLSSGQDRRGHRVDGAERDGLPAPRSRISTFAPAAYDC